MKFLTTKRGIAITLIVVITVVVLALWAWDATIFDPLVSYLNEHGGFAALFLVGAAVLAWLFILLPRKMDPWSIALAVILTIFAFVALLMGMEIGSAAVVSP